jgi:Flp pilus assembly protein TadB
MLAVLAKTARLALVVTLVAAFSVPQDVLAQSHVVSPNELQQQAVAAAQDRQEKIERVQQFFASETAKKALKSADIDYGKIQKAIPQLSDDELATIAAKTDKAQQDFAAGALTNQQITYILIALATAVIVILLVKA